MAWEYLCEQGSMMMNPFEYRETLWTILYEGEKPPPKQDKPAVKGKTPRALGRGRSRGQGMTRHDKAVLEDFVGQIDQLKASRES